MPKELSYHFFTMNGTSPWYLGMWRHPNDRGTKHNDLDLWVEIAKIAERGCVDTLFIADVLGQQGPFRDSYDLVAERSINFPMGDPGAIIGAMLPVTENLGLVWTSSIIQYHPFIFARNMSTLDHLSKGRVGWNIVTSYLANSYRNVGFDGLLEHDERYRWGEEYLDVAYKLWEGSWEEDALVADPKGIFADPAKIHRINHVGKRYSVEGPHLVEPSPQRTPVLFQAGASEAGRTFAARHAEGVFVNVETVEHAPGLVADIRRRVVAAGRPPDDVQIIVGISFVVGSTEEEAWRKANELDQYVDREAAMVQSSGVFGIDLASADPDMPLKRLAEEGHAVRGLLQFFIDSLPDGENATVEDLSRFVATRFRIVGTPETIADEVEKWSETGIDGFNIIQWDIPGNFADFSDHIAPVLQARGLMKREYRPGTLREKLFLGRGPRLPAHHPADGYRRMFMTPSAVGAAS
jgi:FMN-dependent oxidoreductase (nitrilotriacetate monooxygenase family)